MKKDTHENSVQKPRISRLAIASLILAILSLLFPPIAIIAIILAIVSILKIRKNASLLKGKGFITCAMIASALSIALWTMAFMVWSIDADPIPNDYTIADLRSAPPECAPSYELLKSLADKEDYDSNDAPAIGLSEKDINVISELREVYMEDDWAKIPPAVKENEANIIQAWQNSKKARDIVNELNTFPEIADLSEPTYGLEFKHSFKLLMNLGHIAHLYQTFVYLQAEQNKIQDAVTELITIDSVFRKLSSNARFLIAKLVCTTAMRSNIETANFIANNPNCPKNSLELLSENFTPPTNEQLSLRNPLIYQYLLFKNDANLIETTGCTKLLFKRNSVLRIYRNFYDHRIDVLSNSQEIKSRYFSVWPSKHMDWLTVSIGSEHHLPWYYKCYNPMGSMFILYLAYPRIWRCEPEVTTNIQIRSDLLQIVLNKRLGKEINLKARAYSDEYIIDVENKKIFSPGPDGQPHTEDDIKLTINPEVLNFSN